MMPARGEPEPLAFRVRPSLNECFDSWMDRLVARHDTTRKSLFRHLDVDPRLADHDLMRGKASVPVGLHASFDRLIGQLCWAVEIEPEVVMETFVSLPTHWLLPPALRRFGCASAGARPLQKTSRLSLKRNGSYAPAGGVMTTVCPCPSLADGSVGSALAKCHRCFCGFIAVVGIARRNWCARRRGQYDQGHNPRRLLGCPGHGLHGRHWALGRDSGLVPPNKLHLRTVEPLREQSGFFRFR